MDVTLKQIRAFVAVAQAGSFTLAANRLHLTQSAVSVLISELEQPFGLRLFDRTTRLVQLTDAGREFLPVAEKVLADLGHALASSRDLVAKARGRVTVAATPMMSAILLPNVIASYAKVHPGVQVVLCDTLAAQIQPKVRDGEADFGIGTFERSGRELDAEPLMVDSLILVCPAGHALVGRSAGVPWRALSGHAFVALSRDNSVGQMIRDCLLAEGVDVRIVHEVSYLSTMLGMVDAGLGIAVLPSYARPVTHGQRIAVRRLIRPEVRRETSILTRHGRTLSPAALSFKEFLKHHVGTASERALNDAERGA